MTAHSARLAAALLAEAQTVAPRRIAPVELPGGLIAIYVPGPRQPYREPTPSHEAMRRAGACRARSRRRASRMSRVAHLPIDPKEPS